MKFYWEREVRQDTFPSRLLLLARQMEGRKYDVEKPIEKLTVISAGHHVLVMHRGGGMGYVITERWTWSEQPATSLVYHQPICGFGN